MSKLEEKWASVISGWLGQLERMHSHHAGAAKRYKLRDAKYAITTIVLGALTGTSAAGTLVDMSHVSFQYAVGVLGIATSIATGLRQYFNFGRKSQNHSIAASKCSNLVAALELALHFPPKSYDSATQELADFTKVFSEIGSGDATMILPNTTEKERFESQLAMTQEEVNQSIVDLLDAR